MWTIFAKLGDEDSFEKILSLISYSLQNIIELYNKNPTQRNFFLIKNYTIFFMILTINLKKYQTFIKSILKGKSNFFSSLISMIKQIPRKEESKQLFSNLNNLFLGEY